ncbi:MAG: hypothetical protein NT150_04945 [Bacteroidetes bacterium]|nr:hypothetical protein [Bacteroidota bacterium]
MKRILLYSFLLCYGISFSQNLLTNGGFESGFTGWNNLAGDGASATYSLSTADKYEATQAFKVVVNTLGSNAWSIQIWGPIGKLLGREVESGQGNQNICVGENLQSGLYIVKVGNEVLKATKN